MTIAIAIKVGDGIVLSADSAATLFNDQGQISQVYNNANKIINLCKGLPIGFMSWGLGGIGGTSISPLLKDLRKRFAGDDDDHKDWHLDPVTYQLKDVADRVREFLFDEHYQPAFQGSSQKPDLGCVVAGYSARSQFAELWLMHIANGGTCDPPFEQMNAQPGAGITWGGQREAIQRLIVGFGGGIARSLESHLGIKAADFEAVGSKIWDDLDPKFIEPAMPIQDAIDLAEFLAETSVRFSRFAPGAATVGGPIETAAITKHEGFKWVRRKYYYSREINPEGEPHGPK